MSASRVSYKMNPAEDTILYGDEIAEGMWVLRDSEILRPGSEAAEDDQLRAQRFCKVTRLRSHGDKITFIGEWIDGYQRSQGPCHVSHAWIVKKSSLPGAEPEAESAP